MPVYNAVNTIERSIKSFQSLSSLTKINCRLYIIDDCSHDGSLNKANELSKESPNIIIISNKTNIGPGLSRNAALKKIKKGYIGFLDADDEILPAEYLSALNQGIRMGSDWITFNGWFCNQNIKSEKYDFNRLIDDSKQLSARCMRGELDGSVIFTIYSSKLIHKNNLFFPEGYYEDIPFAYSAMLFSKKRYISKNYAYKKHNIDSSIVNTISEKHINGLIDSSIQISENIMDYSLLNYDEIEFDRVYGIYGYIASLIRTIILYDNSNIKKAELFDALNFKINLSLNFKSLNYNIVTKKDKLVDYFLQNYHIENDSFVDDISSYFQKIFHEKI